LDGNSVRPRAPGPGDVIPTMRPVAYPASMRRYVAALDQGTTSSRCIVFDHGGRVAGIAQREHEQIFPHPGWVEHDAGTIWRNTELVLTQALDELGLGRADTAAVGISSHRETTLAWDRGTREPIHHALGRQDTRTDRLVSELGGAEGPSRYQERTGLPLSTYFSGPKLRWILDHVPGAQARAEAGELCFGTV